MAGENGGVTMVKGFVWDGRLKVVEMMGKCEVDGWRKEESLGV